MEAPAMPPLPPLPPLNDKLHMTMRGPTLASNWVIPGIVMAGAYPGSYEDKDNDRQLKCILNKGIDTFVCLQAELDDETPEEVWRSGRGLRPYFPDARRISKVPLVWRHLPIIDGGAADDDVMESLVCDLLDDVKAGRVLYVHCWGGHGRAGIVASLLLAVLYGLPATEAFKRVQGYHDTRIEPQGVKSPTTVVQRSQVKRLLDRWRNKGPGAEISLDPQPSSADVPDEPQVVIGQNGVRGFVVPTTEQNHQMAAGRKDENFLQRSASSPNVAREENNKLSLSRNASKGSLSKLQPISLHAKPLQLNQAISNGSCGRSIGTRQSAAGNGAACVKMLRKPMAQLALR